MQYEFNELQLYYRWLEFHYLPKFVLRSFHCKFDKIVQLDKEMASPHYQALSVHVMQYFIYHNYTAWGRSSRPLHLPTII